MRRRARVLWGVSVVIASVSGVGAPAALALDRPPASQVQPRAFGSCASLVGYAKGHFASTHGWPEPPITGVATATSVGASHGATSTGALATPSAAVAAGRQRRRHAGLLDHERPGGRASTSPTSSRRTARRSSRSRTTRSRRSRSRAAAPQLAGTLDLGANGENAQLLLDGNRLLVIANDRRCCSRSSRCRPMPAAVRRVALLATTARRRVISEVDVSDPAAMAVTQTMTVEGRFVDARQSGTSARIVDLLGAARDRRAAARGRASAAGCRRGGSTTGGTRPASSRARSPRATRSRRPVQFSGLGMLTHHHGRLRPRATATPSRPR